MSDFHALRETSLVLADRLRRAFEEDSQLSPAFIGGGHVVTLRTPREMRSGNPAQVGLSMWLYHVEGNEFVHNRPPVRTDPFHVKRPPLPVNLHYLITPITDEPATEQLMLGKVLQVFHDEPIFLPSPARPELRDELRVSMERVELETLSRVWTSLDEPYQLSLSYIVQVVNIESDREAAEATPVIEKLSDYHQTVVTR